jgi:rsbT co-antagonist protein RsbR
VHVRNCGAELCERAETSMSNNGHDSTPAAGEIAQLHQRIMELEAQVVELAQTKAALFTSQEHIRLFLAHTPISIAMFDHGMRFILISQGWLDGYNLSDRNLIGHTLYEIFPDLPERWKEIHRRCLAGATESAEEDPYPRADGSIQYMTWNICPWYHAPHEIGGIIMVTQDVTQRKLAQDTLRERETQLHDIHREQQQLIEMIREISIPVIPVHDQVLVLPLVGTIDSARSNRIMETLLTGVQKHNAEVVIIDITGVPLVDTGVANHLIQATQAATLLGAHCVLVGVSPEVAQTMVQLGVNLSTLVTLSNLQAGVTYALSRRERATRTRSAHPDGSASLVAKWNS